VNVARVRQLLKTQDFRTLFIEELGWDRHRAPALQVKVGADVFPLEPIAEKRGMVAYLFARGAPTPIHGTRLRIDREVTKTSYEHLIIYANQTSGTQLWQWLSREAGRPPRSRQHWYHRDQPGDALVQKLARISFTLDEAQDLTITRVVDRARQAFDVERVTRHFYEHFQQERRSFLDFVRGLRDAADREWYASLMLNRLMFVYFIQKKGFLDDDVDYLQHRLSAMQRSHGPGHFFSFYRHFLLRLFHEGLGQPQHSVELDALLGNVPYLNGGLFEIHQLEKENSSIEIADEAFDRVFRFFDSYQWHLDERVVRADNEINPDVLGYIFEKYINQKEAGAYYTREDITGYMCVDTIVPTLMQRVDERLRSAGLRPLMDWSALAQQPERYVSPLVQTDDLLADENEREAQARLGEFRELRDALAAGRVRSWDDARSRSLDIERLATDVILACDDAPTLAVFYETLRNLTVLDPTCGSGAFLFAALNILAPFYDVCLQRMESLLNEGGRDLEEALSQSFNKELAAVEAHPNEQYFILKSIIVNSLYGVDIMEEAVEIARLRLFLKLVAEVDSTSQLEPLPDIDFNIHSGNALVGFATLSETREAVEGKGQAVFDFNQEWQSLLSLAETASRAFAAFREAQLRPGSASTSTEKALLTTKMLELRHALDVLSARRAGMHKDSAIERWVEAHKPFHWFIEFHAILSKGGFDVIIGNPPYVRVAQDAQNDAVGVGTAFHELFKAYETVGGGNLYALVTERAIALAAESACWALIVPVSVTFASDFAALRKAIAKSSKAVWYSSYDNIPDRAFTGVKDSDNTSTANQQRVTIVLAERGSGPAKLFATPMLRWRATERDRMFHNLPFARVALGSLSSLQQRRQSDLGWPKIGPGLGPDLLDSIAEWPTLGSYVLPGTPYPLTIPKTAGYYIAACDAPKDRSKQMTLTFRDEKARQLARVLLNSNFFFWFYRVFGDGFDVTQQLVLGCPVPPKPKAGFEVLAEALDRASSECSVFKTYRGLQVPNTNYNLRMDVLLRCDKWLWSHIDEGPLPWENLLRYKSSSWYSFEIARASHWPRGWEQLAARNST
jgi:hypothetical protein